jgi:dolichol-phosphate mannosyltransferase
MTSQPMTKVWVTVPTLDEVENLDALVQRIRAAVDDAHILFVDDGSSDGTADKAEALGAEVGGIEVLRRPRKMGLGSAYRAGHAIGIARGYDVMIQIDADLSHDPAALPSLLAAIEDGADLAIGSRYVPGGGVTDWGPMRRFISRGGSTYARLALGLPVRDLTGGFKCFRREVLEAIDLDTIEARGYAFQVETTYRALKAGFRVAEIPIVFRDRKDGTSKMSRSIVAEAMWRVPAMRFRRR